MSSIQTIEEFLGQHRLAIVGVSRQPKDFSRVLFRAFLDHGYETVPVNPEASEIDGQTCFANLAAIQPPVTAVLLMTPPSVTDKAVRDCADLGIKRVWMYRSHGPGAVTPDAVHFCEANGIAVIPGECPMMFLSDAGWVHRFHGFVKKIARSYPN